jgi:hypothetical protein
MAAAPVNESDNKKNTVKKAKMAIAHTHIFQQDAVEKKPAKMADAKKAGPPKQRGKEEEARVKADREKVKALLAKHRNAMKPKMDELAKQQAKDEQLQVGKFIYCKKFKKLSAFLKPQKSLNISGKLSFICKLVSF